MTSAADCGWNQSGSDIVMENGSQQVCVNKRRKSVNSSISATNFFALSRAGFPYRQNRQMSGAPRPRGPRGALQGPFKAQFGFVNCWKNNKIEI